MGKLAGASEDKALNPRIIEVSCPETASKTLPCISTYGLSLRPRRRVNKQALWCLVGDKASPDIKHVLRTRLHGVSLSGIRDTQNKGLRTGITWAWIPVHLPEGVAWAPSRHTKHHSETQQHGCHKTLQSGLLFVHKVSPVGKAASLVDEVLHIACRGTADQAMSHARHTR